MSTESETTLAAAVRELTRETRSLHDLMKNDYPRRGEVERRFVTKFQQQKLIVVMTLVALATVLGCYVTTVGVYSVCFVGATDDNPGICSRAPGYEERVARLERNEKIDMEQNERLKLLEQKNRNAAGN